MARTSFKIRYGCDFLEAQKKTETTLQSKGFHRETLKTGEKVWKSGTGFLTAMKFVKVEYTQSEIILSAWVQTGFGSVGGKEMDLTGFVGAFPKKQLMNVLEEIKSKF